jgi:hypothetical protein
MEGIRLHAHFNAHARRFSPDPLWLASSIQGLAAAQSNVCVVRQTMMVASL